MKWQGDDKNIERKCDRMSPHFAADFCALLRRRALMAHIPVVFLVIIKIAFPKGYLAKVANNRLDIIPNSVYSLTCN